MPPLVSVLLCTNNARAFVETLALPSYRSQDYPNLELVIVEDGPGTILDLVEDIPGLNYIRLAQGADTLSEKRNIGCRAAHGEYICHFDSDDWSAPGRVSEQVNALRGHPNDQVTGYGSNVLWYDFVDKQASRYTGSIWGANLTYWRSYALDHPWDETVTNAEDSAFLEPARIRNVVVSCDGGQNFVATLHSGNARRPIGQVFSVVGNVRIPCWPVVPISELPEGFRGAVGI